MGPLTPILMPRCVHRAAAVDDDDDDVSVLNSISPCFAAVLAWCAAAAAVVGRLLF